MTHLVHSHIELSQLVSSVSGPGRGGTAIFLGTVRCGPDDGPVEAIEYSAYDEMANSEFDSILSEALEQWPEARAAVVHRLGRIPTGEASIAVVVAAPHRGEAFAASRFVIEETKKRVPIWKKEVFRDGTTDWKSNEDTAQGNAWASRSP